MTVDEVVGVVRASMLTAGCSNIPGIVYGQGCPRTMTDLWSYSSCAFRGLSNTKCDARDLLATLDWSDDSSLVYLTLDPSAVVTLDDGTVVEALEGGKLEFWLSADSAEEASITRINGKESYAASGRVFLAWMGRSLRIVIESPKLRIDGCSFEQYFGAFVEATRQVEPGASSE